MIDSPVTEPEELQQDNNNKTPCAYHLGNKPKPNGRDMKRTLIIASLSVAVLLTMSLTARAEKITEVTVPFDMIVTSGHPQFGGTCAEIDWPLHLVGVSHIVVHDTVVAGVHHFVVENGVHGGATDGAGNTYVFAYNNSLKASFTLSLGDPTTVDFDTDSFNLEGPAGHLHVSFSGSLIFDASGNFIGADLSHAVGNVSCDPI